MINAAQLAQVRPLVLVLLMLSLGAARAMATEDAPVAGAARRPEAAQLPLQDAVSQYGITWTFTESVPVGRFVTGDYYVVGPVTIKSISPAAQNGQNGSMLNPPTDSKSAYDSRIRGYDAALAATAPIRMKPGDSLVSAISHASGGRHKHVYPHFEESGGPLKTAAVLTCLDGPVPADTFRPSYCGPTDRLRRAGDLHRELLPTVPRVEHTPELSLYERIFQRPWLD
ncbi:unnamed protein product, partial [marine sediment metagenome]